MFDIRESQFYYAAGSMGYGDGWLWHRLLGLKFPKFPITTKTITLRKRMGTPFLFMPLGYSFWNRMSLPNMGIENWIKAHRWGSLSDIVVSIAGADDDIEYMAMMLDKLNLYGLELNYSCPNVHDFQNKRIPASRHRIFIKLNYRQNPLDYDLANVSKISVNSVPYAFGGLSGKMAQGCNWDFIKKYAKDFPISGCSWRTEEDLRILSEMGCKSFDIGTVIFSNLQLVLKLGDYAERGD